MSAEVAKRSKNLLTLFFFQLFFVRGRLPLRAIQPLINKVSISVYLTRRRTSAGRASIHQEQFWVQVPPGFYLLVLLLVSSGVLGRQL